MASTILASVFANLPGGCDGKAAVLAPLELGVERHPRRANGSRCASYLKDAGIAPRLPGRLSVRPRGTRPVIFPLRGWRDMSRQVV